MQKILISLACLVASGLVHAESAALMVYKVWEHGAGVYFTRILVTDGHVRFDEGSNASDYTLFDRRKETIYNVSLEESSVLVIEPRIDQVPDTKSLILSENRTVDEQAPMVAGKKPVTVELLANGESCGSVVAIAGLMDDALQALREFKQVLARVQAATLAAQPQELQTACDLASNIHAATRTLDQGLPIEERSEGRVQLLVDFAPEHEVGTQLFTVPEGFAEMRMPTLPAI